MIKMKLILSLIVLTSLIGCSAQEKALKISYRASSRGLFKDVELTEHKISFLKERNAEIRSELKMPKNEWEKVLLHCKGLNSNSENIDLEKLKVDAAIEGVLTIIGLDGNHEAKVFKIDHSNLPVAFKPLVTQILSLTETVE